MQHRSLLLGLFLLVIASSVGVWALVSKEPAAQGYPFPVELVDVNFFHQTRGGIGAPNSTLSFDYDGGGVAVSMRRGELEPGVPPTWHLRDWLEPVSFRTTAVTVARGGELLFVAGIQEDGLDVIERWTYLPRPGGYRIEITSGPPQPIGTPMPAFAGQEVLEGPEFVVPPQQVAPAQRSVVYRGSHMGHVRSLVADPEGRFLLALSYPQGSLYRLNLLQPGLPVLLHTAVDVPHLASATTLAVDHHVELGRFYTATEFLGSRRPPDYRWTVFADPDNDGLLDPPATLTTEEWEAAGFEDYHVWHPYDSFGENFDWWW